MASLRDQTLSGMFWSFLQKAGAKAISFGVFILLARLLSPKDFGLIGMMMIFIQLSQAVVQAGFNSALIQKKDADAEDFSSVFYINLCASLVLYLALFFSAPYIADFYKQPILSKLIKVLSLTIIINAFSYVQQAKLMKEMKFKTLMIVHIPSTIIGGVVAIAMAMGGYGVWSLVAMQLVTILAFSVQLWIHAKWKPLLSFNATKSKSLFAFGSKLMVSGIITSIYSNIYLVVIGKFYPLASIGYYQNANNVATTPSNLFSDILRSVTFPIFSTIQDDDKRLKNGYKRAMQLVFFWICPAYVLAGVLAVPLFEVVFSDKWLPAVPFFQWLCIVGVFSPLNSYNLNIANVKGRSDIWLKLQTVRRIVTIVAIIAVFPFGIMGLMAVQAGSEVFTFVLFSHYAGRLINYSMWDQIKDIFSILLLSVGMGLIILFLDKSLTLLPPFLRIVIGFIVGGSIYGFSVACFKLPSFLDLKHIYRVRVSKMLFDRKLMHRS